MCFCAKKCSLYWAVLYNVYCVHCAVMFFTVCTVLYCEYCVVLYCLYFSVLYYTLPSAFSTLMYYTNFTVICTVEIVLSVRV